MQRGDAEALGSQGRKGSQGASRLDQRWHRPPEAVQVPDFASALAFVNRIGELAEREGHHPDLKLGWGYVEVELSTHAIGGLSENDLILAAKIGEASR